MTWAAVSWLGLFGAFDCNNRVNCWRLARSCCVLLTPPMVPSRAPLLESRGMGAEVSWKGVLPCTTCTWPCIIIGFWP